ncbi:MucBP domain-containing protein, partial [Streptococcus sp. NLN76]|uniref:MucBP domain-containing protein n=1 Tax=Streptococcus sp. NLN76 TaxID=2822800 RepID=UPI0018AC5A02
TETELQNPTVVKPEDSPIGEAYQGTKPAEIVKDGKTYVLSTTQPVRDNQGDAPETGEVKEGKQTIVYQYVLKEEPKGNVIVHYKDTDGNTIKEDVEDTPSSDVDTPYDTKDNKPEVIETPEGKKYKLVPERTEGNEEGKVVEGTTEVTYVYQQVGGEVNARYVIEGTETELQNPTVVKPEDSPIGEAYQGTKPAEIVKDGKTYVLSTTKPVRSNEGDAPETGEVKEGKQTIVYQYVLKEEPKGNVIVHYKDTDGNTIKEDVEDTPSSDVDTPYDTKDNKPEVIETPEGKKYKLVPERTEGNEEGKVVEGTTEVTYVYQQVGGEVNARYVIEGTEEELKDPTVVKPEDSPIGEAYQGTKPAEIEKDGKTYVLSTTKPV